MSLERANGALSFLNPYTKDGTKGNDCQMMLNYYRRNSKIQVITFPVSHRLPRVGAYNESNTLPRVFSDFLTGRNPLCLIRVLPVSLDRNAGFFVVFVQKPCIKRWFHYRQTANKGLPVLFTKPLIITEETRKFKFVKKRHLTRSILHAIR